MVALMHRGMHEESYWRRDRLGNREEDIMVGISLAPVAVASAITQYYNYYHYYYKK